MKEDGGPLEGEGGTVEGEGPPPQGHNPHLNTVQGDVEEGPPTALQQLLQAEEWRKKMGGGRWFVALAGLEEERSRALASRSPKP